MLAPTGRGEQIRGRGALARMAAMGIVAGLLACALLACGSLLGIDDGLLKEDASTFGADAKALDAGALDPPSDGGTPDPVDGDDAAPAPAPSSDGGSPEAAPPPVCVTDPSWCIGRCDQTTDNCGRPVDCGVCEAGVSCFSSTCGCMPDTLATTCAGRQCGQATNNCNLAVNCGVSGSPSCSAGAECDPDAGTCCTPDNAAACSGRCQVSMVNNCGDTVACGSCPGGQECAGTACCVPNGCSGDCVDSCGLTNQGCCAAPPPDAGGACIAMGSPCTSSAACCSGACSAGAICVSACGGDFAMCTSTNPPCCIGFSCQSSIMPQVQGASSSGASPLILSNARCQPPGGGPVTTQ